jgi:hypothetical protein
MVGLLAVGLVTASLAQTQVAANRNSVPATNPADAKKMVFTEEERGSAVKLYKETADLFAKEIGGLSEAQLNFKEDPKRWSIAEVAEHIIIAENGVLSLITNRVLKAPVPIGKDDFRIKDQVIWMTVTNRNTKFNAPDQVQPKGKFKTKSEIMKAFKEARKNTMTFVEKTDIDLRNQFAENPVFGMIDGYQWFLFLNAHSYRHLEQIQAIKAHTDFPSK